MSILKNIKLKLRQKIQKNLGIEDLNKQINSLREIIEKANDITKLPRANGNLRLVQDASVALLNRFNRICKCHDLTYWIDSGTLIGYERHNGFIPWDDDIDICMMRDDYEKLLELLSSHFPKEGFSYRTGEITQFFYKDVPAQIDIFPMDTGYQEVPPEGQEYERFVEKLNLIKDSVVFDSEKVEKRLQTVSDACLKNCYAMRDRDLVPHKHENGFIFYGVETRVKNRACYSRNDIFPLEKISFMGVDAHKPRNAPYYLFMQYGDYMAYPSEFGSNHGISLGKKLNAHNFKECQELINQYSPEVFKN